MPQTCPQCQTEAADDATACPSCGASLGSSSTATQAAPAVSAPTPAAAAPRQRHPAGTAARHAGGGTPSGGGQFVVDPGLQVRRGPLVARRPDRRDCATIVLFISLFFSWFGITVIGITVTASGLSAHGYLYIVMILCILIVAYLVLRAGWDELPIRQNVPHLTVMMVATIVNLVLVFIAFIFKPGGSGVGWEFGAFIGLIAAIVAAAPYAIPQLRAKTMG